MLENIFGSWFAIKFWIDLIPAAIIAISVTWSFKKGKFLLLGFFKRLKIRELRKIKSIRFNKMAVTHEVVKTNCFMVLFLGFCAYFLHSVAGYSNYSGVSKDGLWISVIFASWPLYIFEIFYLSQRTFSQKLIKSVGKIRSK